MEGNNNNLNKSFHFYHNNESFYFYSIINGIKLSFIDLWSDDFDEFNLPLGIENMKIRYDFHNFETEIINYEFENNITIKQLLIMIKAELMKNYFHSDPINHHYLKSIIKNQNENIWYLCWND